MSTSSPLPSVQWFSPQGDLISNNSELEIMNIQRDKIGMYTCIATQLYTGATLNSTVNVTILCECMYHTSDICLRSYWPIFIHTGSARTCSSESTSPWVYVMVVVVVTFMILVTLLAVTIIIVVICWKYSHLKTSIPLPKKGEYVTHQTLYGICLVTHTIS